MALGVREKTPTYLSPALVTSKCVDLENPNAPDVWQGPHESDEQETATEPVDTELESRSRNNIRGAAKGQAYPSGLLAVLQPLDVRSACLAPCVQSCRRNRRDRACADRHRRVTVLPSARRHWFNSSRPECRQPRLAEGSHGNGERARHESRPRSQGRVRRSLSLANSSRCSSAAVKLGPVRIIPRIVRQSAGVAQTSLLPVHPARQ